jgi:hypothetical protein
LSDVRAADVANQYVAGVLQRDRRAGAPAAGGEGEVLDLNAIDADEIASPLVD